MAESWYKEWCPKCDTINWFCNGDEQDLSGVDLDGYKCRKCGFIHYMGSQEILDFEKEMNNWDSLEDCNWELGKERPY